MTGRTIRSVAVWLCAILTFTTLLVVLGRSDDRAFPSITSSKPGGTRLLSEVLTVNGVPVRQDRARIPNTEQDDLLVAFIPRRAEEDVSGAFLDELFRRAQDGSRVVVIYVEESMRRGSIDASNPVSVSNSFRAGNPTLNVSAKLESIPDILDLWGGDGAYNPAGRIAVWQQNGSPLVSYSAYGEGAVIEVADGIGLTNRFIDKHDNASFAVQLFSPLLPTGGSVVFAEAGFGNVSDDSLISAIGGWARATLWQGLLLLVVMGWSLGAMFGLPERTRTRQASTRDLMDAFSNLLRRSKKRSIAVGSVMGALEREARIAVGLPPGASEEQLQQRLPETLTRELVAIRQREHSTIAELESLRSKVHQLAGARKSGRTQVDSSV